MEMVAGAVLIAPAIASSLLLFEPFTHPNGPLVAVSGGLD